VTVAHGAATTVVVGTIMQAPMPGRFEHLPDSVTGVDDDGLIVMVEPRSSALGEQLVGDARQVITLASDAVLLPGLVDLHVHAPQWPQLGTCLDLPLEQWLFEYTFPHEARYVDTQFARTVWTHMVGSMLRHGTTTSVYFVTTDEAATLSLADECLRQGQRAFVGRVAMDHPTGTPAYYRDADAAAGVAASARSIDHIRALDAGRDLLRPIITPRFTPACTDPMLHGLGLLAQTTGVAVQTHCSESDWAHQYSLDRFDVTDTCALDQFGLLRPGSVLAHSNHITDDDAALLIERQVGVAHCPLSNAYFADGVLPTRRLLDRGLRIGLGTDVAGGASPGLLTQCRDAVTMSRVLEAGVDVRTAPSARGVPDARIDIVTAFWMATVSGAAALQIPVGLIEPGRRFDAFVVDTARPGGTIRSWPGLDTPEILFEKVVRLAGADDITMTWVDGRLVSDRRTP
jgi:guanine deaminase